MGIASRRRTSSMAFSVATVGPLCEVMDVEDVTNTEESKSSILIHCVMKSLPSTGAPAINSQRFRDERGGCQPEPERGFFLTSHRALVRAACSPMISALRV